MIKPDDYDVVLQGRSNIFYKAEKLDPDLPDPYQNEDLIAQLAGIPGVKPEPHSKTGKLYIKQLVDQDNSVMAKSRFSGINSAFDSRRYRLSQLN